MEYCTFRINRIVATGDPNSLTGSPVRTINAQALYQDIGNDGKKIYLKEASWGMQMFDLSAGTVRHTAGGVMQFSESGGSVRASRNLLMTIVNPGDLNTPGNAFLFVPNNSIWYGKILLPPEFLMGFHTGQGVLFAAGDLFWYWIHLGYDIE